MVESTSLMMPKSPYWKVTLVSSFIVSEPNSCFSYSVRGLTTSGSGTGGGAYEGSSITLGFISFGLCSSLTTNIGWSVGYYTGMGAKGSTEMGTTGSSISLVAGALILGY